MLFLVSAIFFGFVLFVLLFFDWGSFSSRETPLGGESRENLAGEAGSAVSSSEGSEVGSRVGIFPRRTISVRVLDLDGEPIPNCSVRLFSEVGKVIWSGKTSVAGNAAIHLETSEPQGFLVVDAEDWMPHVLAVKNGFLPRDSPPIQLGPAAHLRLFPGKQAVDGDRHSLTVTISAPDGRKPPSLPSYRTDLLLESRKELLLDSKASYDLSGKSVLCFKIPAGDYFFHFNIGPFYCYKTNLLHLPPGTTTELQLPDRSSSTICGSCVDLQGVPLSDVELVACPVKKILDERGNIKWFDDVAEFPFKTDKKEITQIIKPLRTRSDRSGSFVFQGVQRGAWYEIYPLTKGKFELFRPSVTRERVFQSGAEGIVLVLAPYPTFHLTVMDDTDTPLPGRGTLYIKTEYNSGEDLFIRKDVPSICDIPLRLSRKSNTEGTKSSFLAEARVVAQWADDRIGKGDFQFDPWQESFSASVVAAKGFRYVINEIPFDFSADGMKCCVLNLIWTIPRPSGDRLAQSENYLYNSYWGEYSDPLAYLLHSDFEHRRIAVVAERPVLKTAALWSRDWSQAVIASYKNTDTNGRITNYLKSSILTIRAVFSDLSADEISKTICDVGAIDPGGDDSFIGYWNCDVASGPAKLRRPTGLWYEVKVYFSLKGKKGFVKKVKKRVFLDKDKEVSFRL